MSSLQPYLITAFSEGFRTDKKPFLLPDGAFQKLENAYTWRERIVKRQGNKLLGRLRRTLDQVSLGVSGASVWSFNLFTLTTTGPANGEPNATIVPGSVIISINPSSAMGNILTYNNSTNCEVFTTAPHGLTTGAIIHISGVVATDPNVINGGPYVISVVSATSFTINRNSVGWGVYVSGGVWTQESAAQQLFDQGNGTLATNPATTTTGTINYVTGAMTITNGAAGVATTADFSYFPGLPVMGIPLRDIPLINAEQTIFFDTKYAYIYNGMGFQEWIPGTTWNGSDSDFFWSTNYRGSTADLRLFFVTNNKVDAGSPMRYTDGNTWTTFAPLVSATDTLFQAEILIPYYGRLIALNVWEGTTMGGYTAAVNIFNRARFSQIGDPTAADAWRSDIFGKGGFIDAPTNESITGAAFFKNTLIVFFERTTWQLRYVGQYGLPFLWERISSDFGCESTFSTVIFDQGVLAIGDKAIISSESNTCVRIDEKIPDLVFDIHNAGKGPERVYGVRDFQRELVYWCFTDAQEQETFPNRILVYNYRNKTWATFRDNVTAFGTFQPPTGVTWDSTDVFWQDEDVFWDDIDTQSQFPAIVKGNAQGYIHYFGYTTEDDPSLQITAVDLTVTPNVITSPNHNLETDDVIYITGLMYATTPPVDLNDRFFKVEFLTADIFSISYWDFTTSAYVDTPIGGSSDYIGGGQITLFPRMLLQSKDFNPYMAQGIQPKLSYIDFLIDASTPSDEQAVTSIILNGNTDPANVCNLLVGNNQVLSTLTPPYYTPSCNLAWFRFYATLSAQFFNVSITYDDGLMNTLTTHQQNFIFNAMTLYVRPGSRNVF